MAKKKNKPEITKAVVKVKSIDKIEVQAAKVTNVYSADYKLIDETIEEIKKVSRKVSTNDYAANNVYLILQNALKKVVSAEA